LEGSVDLSGIPKRPAPFDNLLKAHCDRCHGTKKQEADFRVDTQLNADFSDRVNRHRWAEVVDAINSHSMPPDTEPQPAATDSASFIAWATEQTVREELINRSTTIVIRRMNRAEYKNTIRDLIGIEFAAFSGSQ